MEMEYNIVGMNPPFGAQQSALTRTCQLLVGAQEQGLHLGRRQFAVCTRRHKIGRKTQRPHRFAHQHVGGTQATRVNPLPRLLLAQCFTKFKMSVASSVIFRDTILPAL